MLERHEPAYKGLTKKERELLRIPKQERNSLDRINDQARALGTAKERKAINDRLRRGEAPAEWE